MKRKLFAILIAALFLAGCAGIQVSDDASQAVLYKLAGHRLGYELGKADPATAQIVAKAADGIIQPLDGSRRLIDTRSAGLDCDAVDDLVDFHARGSWQSRQ